MSGMRRRMTRSTFRFVRGPRIAGGSEDRRDCLTEEEGGVLADAVEENFEMDVRPGGDAGEADLTDHGSATDGLTFRHEHVGKVRIAADVAIAVIDVYEGPVSAVPAVGRRDHRAAFHRVKR